MAGTVSVTARDAAAGMPAPQGMTVERGAPTLAELFWQRATASASRPAQLVRRGGVWTPVSWAEVGMVTREVALGLLALGHRAGDVVAILARSRPEWVETDFAVFSIGGITVPIYPTYLSDRIAHIVADAGARFLVVDDAAALDRALAARDRMPTLEHVIVLDPGDADARAVGWDALRALGRDRNVAGESVLAARLAAGRPEDVATIVYTSGTTGEPKGVVQTHANHLAMLRALAAIPDVRPGDVHLLFLPLAHSFGRMEAFVAVDRALTTAFAESFDRLPANLREVRPHVLFAVPRLFEKAQARLSGALGSGPGWRRALVDAALRVGRRATVRREAGRPVPPWLALASVAVQRSVLRPLHAAFGGRLRFAISGGAPLGRELAELFHAAGLPVMEGYGLTEACPALTWNRLGCFRLGSVGRALSGVEIAIAADGEVLARGPNVARGYLNRPEETAEVFGADGWLRTGDVGHLDAEGFLYITDRKKDLIITSGGLNIAPQPIEALLRSDPLVAEAMVYGDRRPYATALLTLSPGEVRRFARQHGITDGDVASLVRHPAILARVTALVDARNETLPPHQRIRRFAVVPTEFTEAGGELTPTQKVRRRVVAERYRAILDDLYR